MTARRRAVAAVVAVLAVPVMAAGCSGSSSAVSDTGASSAATTTTAATAATAPPACGNPVASFAPAGPLPAAASIPADSAKTAPLINQIKARGRLIAGVSADTLLFGFRNPFTGRLEGFDVDMVQQVADAILGPNAKVEYRVVTYAQRIPALTSGAVDLVADVMTINCTRWAQIDFSSEYFHAGQRVLVRTDSTAAGIGDLDGRRVCVAEGSTNLVELQQHHPKVVAVTVPDISDCMVLFQQGSVDAVTGDDTVLAGFVAQDPYAKVVGAAFTDEPYGLGMAQGHPDFVQFVNAVLELLRTNGTWTRLYTTWLKPTGAAPAPPAAVYGRPPK